MAHFLVHVLVDIWLSGAGVFGYEGLLQPNLESTAPLWRSRVSTLAVYS